MQLIVYICSRVFVYNTPHLYWIVHIASFGEKRLFSVSNEHYKVVYSRSHKKGTVSEKDPNQDFILLVRLRHSCVVASELCMTFQFHVTVIHVELYFFIFFFSFFLLLRLLCLHCHLHLSSLARTLGSQYRVTTLHR